jgi:hypothetical protein
LADLSVEFIALFLIEISFNSSVVNLSELLKSVSMSETPLVDEQEGKDHCNERECSEKDAASHVLVDMTLRVLATPHFIVMVSSSGLFSVSSSELFSMSSVIATPLAFKVASSVHLVSGSHVYS